jgi:hypothetical protein
MNKVVLHTDGLRGLWSNVAKAVTITDIQLGMGTQWDGEEEIFGELCVYFDTKTWNIYEDGLIYTDGGFLKELREFLDQHGLPGDDVDYSEQGMQDDDYVSLDAGDKFYRAWMAKFNISLEQMVDKV